MVNYLLWSVVVLIAWAVLFAVQRPLRRGGRVGVKIAAFVGKLLLMILIACLLMTIITCNYWKTEYAMAAVYIVLLADLAFDLICLAIFLVQKSLAGRKRPDRKAKAAGREKRALFTVISLLCTVVITAVGTFNMQRVVKSEQTFSSAKLTKEHTFALISDVHTGTAQDFLAVKDVVAQIMQADPDFVILDGDMVDEYTKKDEMQQLFELFGSLKMPVYFIYGNHDGSQLETNGQTFTQEELTEAIEGAGITILADEYVQISEDLVLLGREDKDHSNVYLSSSELEERNPSKDSYLLVAVHQPAPREDLTELSFDLQVSGHTHAGQLFPLCFIENLINFYPLGSYDYNDSKIFVSAGEAGWDFPLRTEAHCEWNLITLTPEN